MNEVFDQFNTTELIESIRRRSGVIVKRAIPRERMIEMLVTGVAPTESEWAETMETRRRLQVFVVKNWEWVNSQIPCTGEGKGSCTTYPCPEGRHIDCFQAANKQDI